MPGDASPDLPCAAADDDASPDLHCEATTTLANSCGVNLVTNWRRELRQSKQPKDGESSIFLKVDWDRIVLDKAHTIKNWRTMSARAAFTLSAHCRPILVLPPTDIQVIECEQSEAEHGFYDALYKKYLPGSGKKFSS
nr:putative SWI/SNF-related matrix-associated actin-dependent regulator of chromatin subfamily A member 3-like 3 [Ipomoea batatas]